MSQKISVKALLQNKYLQLQLKCQELKINTDLFEPVNENTDWNQVINMIDCLFPNSENIEDNLDDVLLLKSISLNENQKIEICKVIKEYLLFLTKIRKYI